MRVMLLTILLCLSGQLVSGQSFSNDEFVRRSLNELADTLFASLPPADTISLSFKCEGCPYDFVLATILAFLKQKVPGLYINSDEAAVSRVDVSLLSSRFFYKKSGGTLLSRGKLSRNFEASMTAILTDKRGLLLWQNAVNRRFSEIIDWEAAENLASLNVDSYKAALPDTNRRRLWEPVIVSGLLAGVVFLFFASR